MLAMLVSAAATPSILGSVNMGATGVFAMLAQDGLPKNGEAAGEAASGTG